MKNLILCLTLILPILADSQSLTSYGYCDQLLKLQWNNVNPLINVSNRFLCLIIDDDFSNRLLMVATVCESLRIRLFSIAVNRTLSKTEMEKLPMSTI